ncbi:MAG: hypothetical protein H0V44_11215 [Planctomycetes bacterium]|nr:hypothetical protein [Planctomycetota bacterium]
MRYAVTSADIERLAVCAAIVEAKGADSPYAADCVVRTYQGRHLSDLFLDLGWEIDSTSEAVIHAGIGTLTMRSNGNQLVEVAPHTSGEPLAADAAKAQERRQICAGCSHYIDANCLVAGCRCAGKGIADNRFSRCPVGKW